MSQLLLLATIAGRRCAFRAEDVQSVIETTNITPIPRAQPHIAGLSALRSQALTVIDCRRAIGLDNSNYETDERVAVVSVGGHSFALQVDKVEEVATTDSEPTDVRGGFGKAWSEVAHGMVETSFGPVLLINVVPLVDGPAEQAAKAA